MNHAMPGSRDPRDLQPRNVRDLQYSIYQRIVVDLMCDTGDRVVSVAIRA